MIHRSVQIELAGRKFRLWLGFSSLRRLGCRSLVETIVKLLAMRDRDADGRVSDFNFEAIEDVLWASLHNDDPAQDGRTLVHCGLSKDQVRALIDDEIITTQDFQAVVLLRIWSALDEAAALAQIIDPQALAGPRKQEVGEDLADPTSTTGSHSDASSAQQPASA